MHKLGGSLLLTLATVPLLSGMSLTLDSSVPSPAPLGTLVTWTATTTDASPGRIWYRFRARAAGQDFHVIRDFGPDNRLDWTRGDHEGSFEIEVTVRNPDTGETAVVTAPFQMDPLVTNGDPVISPTPHPMVFLYSAPPCPEGSRVRVQFQDPDGASQATPFQPCQAGLSMNFYLAGLRSGTDYLVNHTVQTGMTLQDGPTLTLTTSGPPDQLTSATLLQEPAAPVQDGILLQATLFTNTIATDLWGNVVWYYPSNISFLTRPAGGGHFFGVIEDYTGDQSRQIVREFDLIGMTVRETNAARVSEQLVAMGMRPIGAFHHEARRLRNGNILVLATVEQILEGVQGPGAVNVLGDAIVVLDPDLQVVWAWDAFEHLDVRRVATLQDSCGAQSCPPLFLAPTANDWLHGNSVQQTPDGNLLYSSRSQDLVIKIDYQNGAGSGAVLWRLGKDGDFRIDSPDPLPWFSHQHDPQFLADNSTLTLFDNGNVRQAADPNAHSRGQVLQVDEQNRVATVMLNADLGQYSFALGAAQKLPNGNYHFDVGFLSDGTSMSLEVDPAGQTVYALQAGAPAYRTFRMRDLYSAQQ